MKTAQTFLSILALYITSAQGKDEAYGSECADFNNKTWLEYRQQGSKLQVQYLLFTRKDTDCASLFSQESLNRNTDFNSSLPTKIIVHGYRALGSKPSWVRELARALLQAQDANVVVVDWVYGAPSPHNLVVENYKEVAIQISVLINRLQNHGCKLESFHFIGVSLGAHVSGFVGTLFKGQIGRITGLDPAGPMFKGADTYDRLDPSDALFVEAIHTDSDYFGISIPVGHVDFFLNGGMDQPGCARCQNLRMLSVLVYFPVYGYVICDHMRALHVYISALNGTCPLTGISCSSYEDFLEGHCLDCQGVFKGTCPKIGLIQNSGITVNPLPRQEKFFSPDNLNTTFCGECRHNPILILVHLNVSILDKSAEVQVTLRREDFPKRQQKLRATDKNDYRKVMAHPVPLCEIDSIQVKNTGARFYRQGDIHFVSVCISEFPSVREVVPLCVNNIDVRRGSPWNHDFVHLCGDS
ncbi:phospholipase A1 member A [Esox lucius]|uniref:phospholipase A1 member A n=1 Tax=Esox lucius TaxID=8010 RepID=UPI00147776DE|nr:phospholipase A1 member A [Esox lucius]